MAVQQSKAKGVGEYSDTFPATPEVQGFCDMVRKLFEEKYKSVTIYKATKYRQQVVEGTNYIVKIEVDEEYVHVKIFKPLPDVNNGYVRYLDYSPHHTADDPITNF